MSKKRILLKLTGTVFLNQETGELSSQTIIDLIEQMKQLQRTHQFGLVIGGGNFFRGGTHSKMIGIEQAVGHQIGMLATMMNGLILQSLMQSNGLPVQLFCATPSPEIGKPTSQQAINRALQEEQTLIFTGGTGNPFFTTDTNAVLRALQIEADEIWKGTNVDGVYSSDPRTSPNAKRLDHVSFGDAMQKKLGVMDLTAYAMAEQYAKKIRVFDIFTPNALLQAAQNANFGSILEP